VAGDGKQRDRHHHRRGGEQQRDSRRDQRAKHHEQQDERDRHRRQLRLAEVPADQRARGPVSARVSRLPHQQAGVAGLHRGDGSQRGNDRGVHVGGLPRHLEGDQDTAPVGRHQMGAAGAERGADAFGSPGKLAEGGDHLAGCLPHRGVAGEPATLARPDQHVLGGRSGHAEMLEGLLGLAGLAGVVGGQVLGPDQLAAGEDHGNQGQPSEHRGLAVPGAPPGHPGHERPALPAAGVVVGEPPALMSGARRVAVVATWAGSWQY
jgi:hypothetical protein